MKIETSKTINLTKWQSEQLAAATADFITRLTNSEVGRAAIAEELRMMEREKRGGTD